MARKSRDVGWVDRPKKKRRAVWAAAALGLCLVSVLAWQWSCAGRYPGPARVDAPAAPTRPAPQLRPPGEDTPIRPPPPAADVKSNARSAVGYNLDFPGDWTGLPPFVDLMKNARVWMGVCGDVDPDCDPAAHLDLDEHGWVKSLVYRDDPSRAYQRVEAVVLTREGDNGFEGTLLLDYDGNGEIELFNAEVLSDDRHHRRMTFRAGEGSLYLRLRPDPLGTGDYLRNLRMYRSDQADALAQGRLFNPEMIAYLAPFGSLRFMDWMESNQYGLCSGGQAHASECYAEAGQCPGGRCVMAGTWAERPRMDQVSLLSRSQFLDPARPNRGVRIGGYPVEMLVDLANAVGADPHFNLPAAYDDEYAAAFARLVKARLAPNLRPTIEYSNEVWNWGFPQADYVNALGRKSWPDEGSAWVQYAGSRMQNACRIWKRIFADQPGRVRCLISPQTGWQDMARAMMDCPRWAQDHPDLGACYEQADAVAITGYFSGCLQEPQNEATLKGWLADGQKAALDRFFEQLERGGLLGCAEDDLETSLAAAIQLYRDFAKLARERDLELYVYESGTHFNYEGQSESVRQLFVAACRDPRMGQLYRKNLDAYRAAGGTIFNAWGWIAPDDAWSNSDNVHDHAHPKYRALADFAREVPCWWEGCDRSRR